MRQHLCRATAIARLLASTALATLGTQACKGKSGGGAPAGAGSVASTPPASPVAVPVFHGFEGELDFVVKDAKKTAGAAGQSIPVYLVIKGDKVRAEIPQALSSKQVPKGHIVLSTPEKKLYLVMDEQKQIVVVDLNKAGEELKSFAAGLPKTGKGALGESPTKPPPKVTKTGIIDKVADIPCQNWDVTDESHKVATLCIADQGAPWFHLPVPGIPSEYAWTQELMDGKHFPLRMIAYDKTGAEQGRAELTKLENKPLAEVLFEMPAGYKVVDLGAMMSQLGGMQGMPQPGRIPGQIPKKQK